MLAALSPSICCSRPPHPWSGARHEQAQRLRELGIEPVHGNLDDSALLMQEAQAADAVINCASSDHREAIESLLTGLRGSGKPLLHTSGSSQIGDAAAGNSLNEQIYDEETPLVVDEGKRARYELDRRILAAQGVRGIVICNTLIYGTGKGLHADSVQIPALADQARASGVVQIVGAGLNRWSTVHIDDVCTLYQLALEQAPAVPSISPRTAKPHSPGSLRLSANGLALPASNT